MLNQIILVGRIVNELEVKELGNGKKVSKLTLAITRSYKNMDGEYEVDYIPVILWTGIAETTAEYCHKGDVVGVKGRVQCKKVDRMLCNRIEQVDELEIVAEKVTFLSSARKDEE